MASAVTIKTKSGSTPSGVPNASNQIQVPFDSNSLLRAVAQLQLTLNALIVRFNAHQHAALNAAPPVGFQHDGSAQAAANLFTTQA